MKNIIRFLFGFLFFALGLFGFGACFFYHSSDASFNTGSSESVQNLLGFPGAVTADLLLQIFGVLAFLIPTALCVFGFFLVRKRRWLLFRFFMFILALLGAAWLMGGSVVPVRGIWTKAGAGGFLGFYLTQWFSSDIGYWRWLGWIFVVATLVLTLRVPVFLVCRWSSKKVYEKASAVKMPKISLAKKETKRSSVVEARAAVDTAEEKTDKKSKLSLGLFRKKEKKESPKRRERREPTFTGFMGDGVAEEVVSVSEPEKTPHKASKSPAKSAQTGTGGNKKGAFELPSSALLDAVQASTAPALSKESMERISRELEEVLKQFSIGGKIIGARPGPVVTLYEFEPAPGIKTSRIISLADDVAMKMCVVSVRIAVIPGTNAIGIEMPNAKRDVVYIREMVEHVKFRSSSGVLPLILGKDIGGTPVFADLAKMPHLLVAGTTGSGKSVAVNTMILSLLYRFTPAECRLIMVDPKMVELSVYNRVPHLLTPVVTEPEKAVVALKWAVREMEDRYRSMSHLGVRNIEGYNQKLRQAAESGQTLTRRVQTGFDPETGKPVFEEQEFDLTPIPYIVIIVDEMADLMGRCGKEVDPLIQRLAQMARAVGIHLILATQRPSVDVITGTIKSNFPSRMSFQVRSKIDSRTILDEQGAEQLLGKGDMLFMPAGQKPQRVHGPFVSDADVERVVGFWENQAEPEYLEAVTTDVDEGSGTMGGAAIGVGGGEGSGDLYDKAVAIILRDKKVSTSYVQRQLRIGYNKAADLIDRMEAEGVISKPNMAGKREILVPTDNA